MEQLRQAIKNRDMPAALARIIERSENGQPVVRAGFRHEHPLWDFKQGLPAQRVDTTAAWARVAADVLAFHNAEGGVLLYGITDRDYDFVGTRDSCDAKRFNDKIRRWVGDTIWVEFSREYVQADQRFLGVALIPPRGLTPLRTKADAPQTASGDILFHAGDLCIREGDETRILTGAAASSYLASKRLPSPDAKFAVREPNARILRPDWEEFVTRQEVCASLLKGLGDDRTYVTTVSGIGGIGKTAAACWAVLQAYEKQMFEYFVSVSAKDRELTESGMRPVDPTLTSFEDLLNQILEVLGITDAKTESPEKREAIVRDYLPLASTLIFVDNLETVTDARVVRFLETLPKPAKAITTSRTSPIRTAAFPIVVGPLTVPEATRFWDYHAGRRGKTALLSASPAEKERYVAACSRVPLAIEWLVGHSRDLEVAGRIATAMEGSGKRDAELLEFCFRRVHEALKPASRDVLGALSLHEDPQRLEALSIACGQALDTVDDCLGDLEACSLVERTWDERLHDFVFRCLPITRRFAYRDLQARAGREVEMRAALSAWYEGRDIGDASRRKMISEMRRGLADPEAILVDAAITFRKEGRTAEAESYFQKALDRNPRSWRAHREYAELLRDLRSYGEALKHYELAGTHAPKRGPDRALVFREWGMELRRSAKADAHEQAVAKFLIALRETPNDTFLHHALANSYVQLGFFAKARPWLEVLVKSTDAETRARSYGLLERCYVALSETIQLAELRQRMEADGDASRALISSKRTIEGSSRPLTHGDRKQGRGGRRRR